MPTKRPTSVGRPVRHLHAVPDDAQPALWDSGELERLARLRQLAIETGAPSEAIRMIDRAATADEAIAMLTDAGHMPTETDADEGLLSWFAPLLEPSCEPLEAELCGAEFVGELRRTAPPNLEVADVLRDIIKDFAQRRSAEVLAMMRVLGAVAPGPLRTMAGHAAARLVRDGLADMPWAADLGWPVPGRCFGYTDIYGEQRSMVLTFSYGRKVHAVVVLIDYLLGGGIKDCYVADYTESVRREYQRLGRDPDIIYSDLDPGEARAILTRSLSYEPCPADPDQIENVENYIDLVAARVAALPAPPRQARRSGNQASAFGPVAGATTRPPSRAKNIHRLKVTVRGVKPPIWRRLEVPSHITLERLHRVIQVSFGWQDHHRHAFETAVGRYGTPDPDGDADNFNDAYKKLSAVADWPGDRFRYTYDRGDNGELDIVVEAVLRAEPGVAYPRCAGGRRSGPPEDSGGAGGSDPAAFDLAVVNLNLPSKVLVKP